VAVVTGANRGIGLALAARLGEHGITVVLTARDAERGEAAAAALRARGLHVVFHRLDVADPASVQAFAAWLRDAIGGLDILVSQSAITSNQTPFPFSEVSARPSLLRLLHSPDDGNVSYRQQFRPRSATLILHSKRSRSV
jgi:NAD(P)-dependent dehydrogenase (short-subunit alcohol dehydrogenase family)